MRETTKQLYAAIRSDYKKLDAVREYGAKKYTPDWILAKLGAKHHKSPKTIENIIFGRR